MSHVSMSHVSPAPRRARAITVTLLPLFLSIALVLLSIALAAPAGAAPQLTTLVNFDSTNGANPAAGLIRDSAGNLYGTTQNGGSGAGGTVFELSPAGTLATLINFAGTNGSLSEAGLIRDSAGNLYGTTYEGGSAGQGTVFKVSPAGTLAALVDFDSTNGGGPAANLIQGSDGNLYGTTDYGGSAGYGTVFKLSPAGTLTTLVDFDNTNGAYPQAGLIQDAEGNLYGTTSGGGSAVSPSNPYGDGTVFRLSPAGTLTTLVNFTGANGNGPQADLIRDSAGNFYGTTSGGGSAVSPSNPYGDGTVFRLSPAGALTTLVNFTGTNGTGPQAGLIQDSAGNLYGTTSGGGSTISPDNPFGEGTVFESSPTGALTTLVNFDSTNGANPVAGLIQDSEGNLYGTTELGGSAGYGTVFKVSLSVPRPSITSFTPTAGGAGTVVTITGTNLTGTTIVGFMGQQAKTFTVNAAGTRITTTVPAGAATGPVTVLTGGVEAKSPASFVVVPTPAISAISPAAATAGSGAFSLTITGSDFVNGAVVFWNGQPLPTYYLNSTTVSADVPASYVATAGEAKITLANGRSPQTAPLTFTVTAAR